MKSIRKSWLGWLALTLVAAPAVYAQSPEYDAQSGSVRVSGGDPYATYRGGAALAPIPDGQAVYQNWGPDQMFGGGHLPPEGVKIDPAFRAAAGLGGPSLSELDRIRFDIYKQSGEMAGQGTGFTNISAFVPYRVFSDYNLFAINPRLLIDDTGNAGVNLGLIHRFYVPDQDRMYGSSIWWDHSRSYHDDMNQFGVSLETVGRYLSYRFNGNFVVGNRARVFHQQFFDPVLGGNNIFLPSLESFETGVSNYSMEVAMPAPFLGKYGLELGVGPYFMTASGVKDTIGVSGRAQWQVTEDLWVNTIVTNDDLFDTNVSVNFELRLPDGMPSRIARPNPVVMSLVQSVQRNYQVKVARAQRMKYSAEINPKDNQALQIAFIDPNAAGGGNGSFENPYGSTQDYMNAPLASRQGYDIIFVRRRDDGTDTNLNGTLTLEFCQRLLGDGTLPDRIPHLYTSTRGTFVLPGQTPGALPLLTNNHPGVLPGTPIVRLDDMNEVSGFRFNGAGTGGAGQTSVGILGVGTRGFDINRNFFHNVTDAVRITTDVAALGTQNIGRLDQNTVTGASDDGFEIRSIGAADPLRLDITNNIVRNAADDGLNLVMIGSRLNGRITDNQFRFNGDNGVQIDVGAGSHINMAGATSGRVVARNVFSGNANNGFQVNAVDGSDPMISMIVAANQFGEASSTRSANSVDGFDFNVNSGTTHLVIGGSAAADGNLFINNLQRAIDLNFFGTAQTNLQIANNVISLFAGAGGNIFLTGHDVDFHGGQNGFDTVILDFLRGAGTPDEIFEADYDLAVLSSGVGFWNFSNGTQTLPNYGSVTVYDTNQLIANPALWDQVFASDGIMIVSHTTVGGGDLDTPGSNAINAQATQIAAFVSAGGDVWANSGANLPSYYNFLPPGVVATGAQIAGISGFAATPAGVAIGITDVAPNSMINGFPTHNAFPTFDPNFTVFEIRPFDDLGNPITPPETVSIGVSGAVVSSTGFVTQGLDGIRIRTSDSARLISSNITNNSISSYAENGLNIISSGNSIVRNLNIVGNTFNRNGNSVHFNRMDSADLNVIRLIGNTQQSANLNGLYIQASGTAAPSSSFRLFDNDFSNSGDSNLRIETSGDAVVNFFGPRDRFDNGNAGLTSTLDDNSVQNLVFQNTTFNNNETHGQRITANDNTTLNYTYSSPRDPGATFNSTTNGNGSYGLLVEANDTAQYSLAIGTPAGAGVIFDGNGDVGIGVTAAGNTIGSINISNTTVSNTVDAADPYFNGDGLAVRLRGNARLTQLNVGQTTASNTNFTANAGDGVRLDIDENSRLANPLFDRIVSNGNAGNGFSLIVDGSSAVPNARIWRSTFNGNGQDGIHIEREGGGVIDNFVIGGRDGLGNVVGNSVNGNGGDGLEIIARQSSNIDEYLISENSFSGNGVDATLQGRRGIHLRAEGDAQINADVLFNQINNNGTHGIQATSASNATNGDGRSVTGRWLGNNINNNGADGVNVGGAHGFLGTVVQPLQIGDLGVDALGRSLGNTIRGNVESGVDIEPFSDFFVGPFGTSVANVTNNLIELNGESGIEVQPSIGTTPNSVVTLFGNGVNTNITDNRIFENAVHGITFEGQTTGFLNGFVQRNEIRRNGRDGIQILASSGNGSILTVDQSVFVAITDNNFITDNGGRGVDTLVRGTANAQVIIDEAFIARNDEEGVYSVVTADIEQSNEVRSSVALGQNGVATNDAFLDLTVTRSMIVDNNQAGGGVGGGLVNRVGTTGASPFANQWADPDTTDPSARGGLLFRADDNFINNNFGIDFFMHTFTSTVDPNTTGGTWSDNNSNPRNDAPNPPGNNTFNPTGYQQDPLARITVLSFSGNSGGSADVLGVSQVFTNQNFAFYNNNEDTFKSRTANQDGTDPSAGIDPVTGIRIDDQGPFANNPGGTRVRNATRLPYRDADGDGQPDVPPILQIIHGGRDSNDFLFPGLGPSTLRVDQFSDLLLSGFNTVISDFTSIRTYANSGNPVGILPPNSPWYAWDTF